MIHNYDVRSDGWWTGAEVMCECRCRILFDYCCYRGRMMASAATGRRTQLLHGLEKKSECCKKKKRCRNVHYLFCKKTCGGDFPQSPHAGGEDEEWSSGLGRLRRGFWLDSLMVDGGCRGWRWFMVLNDNWLTEERERDYCQLTRDWLKAGMSGSDWMKTRMSRWSLETAGNFAVTSWRNFG